MMHWKVTNFIKLFLIFSNSNFHVIQYTGPIMDVLVTTAQHILRLQMENASRYTWKLEIYWISSYGQPTRSDMWSYSLRVGWTANSFPPQKKLIMKRYTGLQILDIYSNINNKKWAWHLEPAVCVRKVLRNWNQEKLHNIS